jgi:hypothetical protein
MAGAFAEAGAVEEAALITHHLCSQYPTLVIPSGYPSLFMFNRGS